ncbi:MAG TPA: helix-turn-helix transcriptional regulator [Chroococcales cyanobacterium]|jgi:DNA-binding CsgD family transcriptional regulator
MTLTKNPGIQPSTTTLENLTSHNRQLDCVPLQGVLESFIDGILIVDERGNWVQANAIAQQICDRLTRNKTQANGLPAEIWHVCKAMIENRKAYPGQIAIVEVEIKLDKLTNIRIRAQWLKLQQISYPYLLVILENRFQSLQNLALIESDRYGLTPREAEVWSLYRANYTRKEIAAELFISIDTVKKHLKNIKAKRETVFDLEDWQIN